MRFKRDVADGMVEEAEQHGLEQGLKQEIEQNKIETAQKLLQKGMDTSEIAEITGLTEGQIRGWSITIRRTSPRV